MQPFKSYPELVLVVVHDSQADKVPLPKLAKESLRVTLQKTRQLYNMSACNQIWIIFSKRASMIAADDVEQNTYIINS